MRVEAARLLGEMGSQAPLIYQMRPVGELAAGVASSTSFAFQAGLLGTVPASTSNDPDGDGVDDDADGNGVVSIGDTLTYRLTVANAGNVTLTDVTIWTETGPVSGATKL